MPLTFSPWHMYLESGLVVRGVMSLLAGASIASWIIFLAKLVELMLYNRRVRRDYRVLDRANDLSDADTVTQKEAVLAHLMILVAREERERSAEITHDRDGIKERTVLHLERIEAAEGRRLNRGTGFLAIVGSTAPFVGLFGTVWGIMSSFTGIAAAHATSLAVVAPGIAEALLATAVGLAAAIPAVVSYNILSRLMAGCRAHVADLTSLVMRLVSRDLSLAEGPKKTHPLSGAKE